MAYLARRPGTEMWLARMLLLPLVVLLSLRAAFAYMWLEARFSVYNWGQGKLRFTRYTAPFWTSVLIPIKL